MEATTQKRVIRLVTSSSVPSTTPSPAQDDQTLIFHPAFKKRLRDQADEIILRSNDHISFRCSASKLATISSFFEHLMSLPRSTTDDKSPSVATLDLPSATSDGLSTVLFALFAPTRDDWTRGSGLEERMYRALEVADAYDIPSFVISVGPRLNHLKLANKFNEFALAAVFGLDQQAAIASAQTLQHDLCEMSSITLQLLAIWAQSIWNNYKRYIDIGKLGY